MKKFSCNRFNHTGEKSLATFEWGDNSAKVYKNTCKCNDCKKNEYEFLAIYFSKGKEVERIARKFEANLVARIAIVSSWYNSGKIANTLSQ
jgi:hypothetical protein